MEEVDDALGMSTDETPSGRNPYCKHRFHEAELLDLIEHMILILQKEMAKNTASLQQKIDTHNTNSV